MTRTVLLYALGLAACAFALQWLQYKYLARTHAGDFYLLLIAVACMGLGGWAGWRLTRKDPPAPFAVNEAALKSLGVIPGGNSRFAWFEDPEGNRLGLFEPAKK